MRDRAEAKAVQFLQTEVPKWSQENGCFSCHNNGDAARALFAALDSGYRIPSAATADTVSWVTQPDNWSKNKGDPGFSDQRLADIQFAAALHSLPVRAPPADASTRRAALRRAAERIAASQDSDGSWRIEPQNEVGSPATYGTALATLMAWRTIQAADHDGFGEPLRKAKAWLHQLKPNNVPAAAVVIMASMESLPVAGTPVDSRVTSALHYLEKAQTSDGGWGPYADVPAEAFDTALALLALKMVSPSRTTAARVERGRQFLKSIQQADGSWQATTRPSGGTSYAQQVSTTGWAALALLSTREGTTD